MDASVMRSLPQSIEAEQSVLGSMIIDKNAIAKVLESLEEEDFYRDGHKIIYRSILDMFRSDIAIDLLTLLEYLKSTDMLERAGGVTYITELSASVPTTANLSAYIKIVSDKSTLRKLIKSSTTIIEESYNNQSNVEDVVDSAEKKIFNIAEKRTSKDFEPLSDVLERGFAQIEKLFNEKGTVTGVASGFTDLDAKTSGFQSGDMVLIAARPSMGKTTFALNIVEYAALKENKSVVVFSLEMSKEQLAYKLLCSEANVDMLRLRTGALEDKDWENIAMAAGPLSKAKIYIDDTAGVTVMEMRSKCRRLKIEYGIDLIVIDYLQLMSGGTGTDNRQQEVSEISRSIKALAKEMECPVIALSQLSRAPEQRADHRPMLSDLRESGSIEQDADVVMFLYRDEYYDKETEDKNMAECIMAKQRNGPVGTVKLAWLGQFSKFGNLDVIHRE
ncbi:replicative DNA helicase [Clostridium saccharoperbutylacetonicum]|uniref:Replicative DNA helicase n=2 Tax=Clostridium TaxID=1485 RepID=M1M1N5_9CLOT|nr:replicative DNA helicase [Clostridium saccharoperbutylacetonicum]AGF59535.1 replicative DNA helicase DnaC [Clostridium saccharoperbutylacetonicum N1-4(HMT)]NRT59668.1 replicative DNA helicase [Clostridium saccharoperbutylacetonicum]NSB28861.1 replicative DNA helicase [Clostridium saccharoperbutylacetonicum]NSB42351.1 replicative DNA helicase [Clostridium saccharoperbutylacetonicum]